MFEKKDKTLILGISQTGKTHLARQIQHAYPRCFVFDLTDEYEEKTTPEHYKWTITTFEQFCDVLLILSKNKPKKFRVIIRLDPEIKDAEKIFNEMFRLIYYLGDCCVDIEECHELAGVHKMPRWLRNLFTRGAHKDISLIITTQRISLLNKTIISQCKHVFCGQTLEPNDLKYLKSSLGEWTLQLPEIEPRFFLYYSPRKKIEKVHNSLSKNY